MLLDCGLHHRMQSGASRRKGCGQNVDRNLAEWTKIRNFVPVIKTSLNMATITRSLSSKVNGNGESEIMLRLSVSRDLRLRLKSGIFVEPSRFRDGKFVMPRADRKTLANLQTISDNLVSLESRLVSLCVNTPQNLLSKEFFEDAIMRHNHPELFETTPVSRNFFDTFNEYLDTTQDGTKLSSHYRVLARLLERYEKYKQKSTRQKFTLKLEEFTGEMVDAFKQFVIDEPKIYERYPSIYKEASAIVETKRKPRKPEQRGHNAVIAIMKRLRAFFNWCVKRGYITRTPFATCTSIGAEKYGTPYYITIEERDKIANFDFSSKAALEIQRDIFIFQCLIGCRVSDLIEMTPESIINGAVEYMPNKTKGERPEVVRVPLNKRALALVKKYKGKDSQGRLFPFISTQKYNDAIKKIFTECEIRRIVTVLNPKTGEEERRPLNEIASGHMARRTFVGNLYKKVKDPSLVGALSGHKEGSKAFARYREIDEDIKKELVGLLD